MDGKGSGSGQRARLWPGLGAALAAMLWLAAAPARADFEAGAQAYLQGDYQKALAEWVPLAEKGNASAEFGLGLAYENGRGVEKDVAAAAGWYRKAADKGLADAQFNLGNLYLNGLGVPKDLAEAAKLFRAAANQGMPHAQVNLGYSYETGAGVSQDAAEAVNWYRRAAEQNFAPAQYYLGAAYERGVGVEKDLQSAANWYQRAAKQGISNAEQRLELLRAQGFEPTAETAAAETPAASQPKPEAAVAKSPTKPEPSPEAAIAKTETPAVSDEAEPQKAAEPQPAAPPKAAEAPAAEAPAAEAPAEPPKEVKQAAVGGTTSLQGKHRIRLAAYRDPAGAEKGWGVLLKKHVDVLGTLSHGVSKVDLGPDKGIFYRLEAGPFGSAAEAKVACTEVTKRGDPCATVTP